MQTGWVGSYLPVLGTSAGFLPTQLGKQEDQCRFYQYHLVLVFDGQRQWRIHVRQRPTTNNQQHTHKAGAIHSLCKVGKCVWFPKHHAVCCCGQMSSMCIVVSITTMQNEKQSMAYSNKTTWAQLVTHQPSKCRTLHTCPKDVYGAIFLLLQL
jgi:hypothetical protein